MNRFQQQSFIGENTMIKQVCKPTAVDYALAHLLNQKIISKRTTLEGRVVNSEAETREILTQLARLPGVEIRALARALTACGKATLEVIEQPCFIKLGYRRSQAAWQQIVSLVKRVLVFHEARLRVNALRKTYWENQNA